MATLPCIGIARTAGLKLREMLKSGPVRVWFRATVENGWRSLQITVGEIKGKSDDFVVVGGHQDSWFGPQATDNAAGNACIIELARVFNQNREKLRRGLVCGFWTGHETGTMVGSSWYVDRNWDRLRRHAVAYLQIDQPACAGTSRWGGVRKHRAAALPSGNGAAAPRQPADHVATRGEERRRLVLRPRCADAQRPGHLHRG
jgi:Zn-dependent M28 family amino/carboxypeptidase